MNFVVFFLTFVLSLYGEVMGQSTCAATWNQCGGIGYTGPTCCASGATCSILNPYFSQCIPASTTSGPTGSGAPGGGNPIVTTSEYTTSTVIPTSAATQPPYPVVAASTCGSWELVDNVCCPNYCLSNNESESCTTPCAGGCGTPPSSMCMSGTMWGEQLTVGTNEPWHYSRSTHFGLTSGGACGFGLYGLCTKGSVTASWTDPLLGTTCDAFCTAYPLLCQDPKNVTLRGNFAAPNGDYYTQFWPSLSAAMPGDQDNYLSCGECFQLIMTKADGTDYAVGEEGFTPPIYLEIVDSCPCDANSKW